MKVKHLLVALIVPLACACSNDSLNEVVDNSNQPQVVSRSVENMLSFDSEASFHQAVATLKSIDSWEEKEAWVKLNFGNFESMQSVYEAAANEAESLDDTKEEYMKFKNKYSSLYFPMYEEDYGYYIPLKDLETAFLVNKDGDVCIAGNVVNKKDLSSYQELMYLGRAYYSNGINLVAEVATELKDGVVIGEKYESGWHKENGKKINFKARRLMRDGALKLHIEVSFRKKTWLGWTNYKSHTKLTGEIQLYTDSGILAQTLPLSHESDHASSHDSYTGPLAMGIGSKVPSGNAYKQYYRVYKVLGTASVEYRGMPTVQKYSWSMAPADGFVYSR